MRKLSCEYQQHKQNSKNSTEEIALVFARMVQQFEKWQILEWYERIYISNNAETLCLNDEFISKKSIDTAEKEHRKYPEKWTI